MQDAVTVVGMVTRVPVRVEVEVTSAIGTKCEQNAEAVSDARTCLQMSVSPRALRPARGTCRAEA